MSVEIFGRSTSNYRNDSEVCYVSVVFPSNMTLYSFSAFSFGGGFLLVANDIAPAYAGIVFGISNTFATLPGIISTYVVGALTDKVSLNIILRISSDKKPIFILMFRIQATGKLCFSSAQVFMYLEPLYFYYLARVRYNHGR